MTWWSKAEAGRALRGGAAALPGGGRAVADREREPDHGAGRLLRRLVRREGPRGGREACASSSSSTTSSPRLSLDEHRGRPRGPQGRVAGAHRLAVGQRPRAAVDAAAFYVEQRWIPGLEYSPWLRGRAGHLPRPVRGGLPLGPRRQRLQQNEGGGFNADQVNIQTKNVNVALYPTRNPTGSRCSSAPSPSTTPIFDPTRTPLNDIIRTGYKLAFLGSDATGLSLFSNYKGLAKLSLLPLGTRAGGQGDEG